MTTRATPTKLTILIGKLSTSKGANLATLRIVTGWQPHSIRAAISGLRKRGHGIERRDAADPTKGPIYRIVAGKAS